MENNNITYRVTTNQGQTKDYTEKDYLKNNVPGYLEKYLPGQYSVQRLDEVTNVAPDNIEDEYEYLMSVPNMDGTIASKVYTGKELKDNNLIDGYFVKNFFGKYKMQRIRTYDDAEMAYRGDALAAKELSDRDAIDAFDAQNGAFMEDYKQKQKIYDTGSRSYGSWDDPNFVKTADYVVTRRADYDALNKERRRLQYEYESNPLVQSAYEQEAKQAQAAADLNLEKENSSSGQDYNNYKNARKFDLDAAQLYSLPIRSLDDSIDKEFLKGMGKGVVDAFADRDFWTMGVTEIARNVGVSKIFEDLKERGLDISEMSEQDFDNALTDSQKALLFSFMRYTEAAAQRSGSMPKGYSAGQISAESLGFMAQFFITGGVGSAIAKGVGKAATKAVVKGTASGLAKFLSRATNGSVRGIVEQSVKRNMVKDMTANGAKYLTKDMKPLITIASKTAGGLYEYGVKPLARSVARTPFMMSTYVAASEDLLQRAQSPEEVGSIGSAFLQSVWNSLPDQIIENWSEDMGPAIGALGETIKKGAGKVLGSTIGKINVGEITLGQWGKWVADSYTNKVLLQAGFNGLVGEMAEEWLGNAARVAVGIMDKEDFKEFADPRQQVEMAISFAPMSLLGLGSSSVAAAKQAKEYRASVEEMRGVLNRAGMTKDEIANILDTQHTKQEIADALTPVLNKIISNASTETGRQTSIDDYKATLRFARNIAASEVMDAANEVYQQEYRNHIREQISNELGATSMDDPRGKFSYEIPMDGGNSMEVVTLVKDANGKEYYNIGAQGSQIALKKANGGDIVFVDQKDYEEKLASGEYQANTQSASSFLDYRVSTEKETAEREARDNQLIEAKNKIINTYKANPQINLGTKDTPKIGTVTGFLADGVLVEFEKPTEVNGVSKAVHKISYEQAGNAIGVDAVYRSEEEKAQDEADNIARRQKEVSAYNKQFKGMEFTSDGKAYKFIRMVDAPFVDENGVEMVEVSAQDGDNVSEVNIPLADLKDRLNEQNTAQLNADKDKADIDASKEDDGTPKDFRGNPLPMKTNGSGELEVDTDALWNKDPEAYLRWNDSQRGGNTEDSQEMLSATIVKEQAQKDALINAKSAETVPSARQALDRQITEIDNRINLYSAILHKYQSESNFKQKQQEYANALADIKRRMLDAKTQERYDELKQAETELTRNYIYETLDSSYNLKLAQLCTDLQAELNKIADMPVSMVTYATVESTMREKGASDEAINSVLQKIAAVNRENLTSGHHYVIKGCHNNGIVYIFAEGNADIEEATKSYYHERQHEINAKEDTKVVDEVFSLASNDADALYKTLETIIGEGAASNYKGSSARVLADEIVAFTIQEAYTNKNYIQALKDLGLTDNLITVISKEYGRQTGKEDSVSKRSEDGNRDEHRSGQGTSKPDEQTDGGKSADEQLGSIRQGEPSEQSGEIVGRTLTSEEADVLITQMEDSAEVAPEIELTPDNWLSQFGEDGLVDTPIGNVKMGENQYFKIILKNRAKEFGMIYPTLSNPDIVIEEPSTSDTAERNTSLLFVKTFVVNGEKVKYYASVTVSKDSKEVVISNHFIEKAAFKKKLLADSTLYLKPSLSNSFDRHLAEHQDDVPDLLPTQDSNGSKSEFSLHPTTQIEESVPLNDSNRLTNSNTQPANLGINSSETTSEGTNYEPKKQKNGEEKGITTNPTSASNKNKAKENEERAKEERRQRLLSHPTKMDKDFGLIPVKDIKSSADIISNIEKIVSTLANNEKGITDVEHPLSNYGGYISEHRFLFNTQKQVEQYVRSLDIVDSKITDEWKSATGIDNVEKLANYVKKLYEESQTEIKPIGNGPFGAIYDQFKGKAKEAIEFLRSKKSGEAVGALHHKDIGDIDLVWGEEGTGKSDGFGLAKLLKYHPEVLDILQELLDTMEIVSQTDNRIQLESKTHKESIRLTWNDRKKNWLLTAYEKKNSASDNTTDTDETLSSKRNDTATPQNTVSNGKSTQSSETKQEASETPKEYIYRLNVRPFGVGNQPDGGRKVDDGSKFGAVAYDKPLSIDDIKRYTLTAITDAKQLEGKSFSVPFGKYKLIYSVGSVDENGNITYTMKSTREGAVESAPQTSTYTELKDKFNGKETEVKASNDNVLTDEEVVTITDAMKANATIAPIVEINDANWKETVDTPIGSVKMGENQKAKLFAKGREQQYGMLIETLSNPDVVLEERDRGQNTFHERPSLYLFVKTFQKEDGSKYVHFESVTISQEGMEISISSHIIRENQLKNKLKSDRLLYKATALDAPANTSAEQPIVGGSLSSKRQAERNGGELIMLSNDKVESLSTPTPGLSSRSEVKQSSETKQISKKNGSAPRIKKVNPFDFVDKDKNTQRPIFKGVYHDNGMLVATDAKILIAIKDNYPEELEGTLTFKDGHVTADVKFPNWRAVFDKKSTGEQTKVDITLDKLASYLDKIKADVPKKILTDEDRKASFVVIDFEYGVSSAYNYEYLVKFVNAARYLNAQVSYCSTGGSSWNSSNKKLIAEGTNGKVALFPVTFESEKDYKFNYNIPLNEAGETHFSIAELSNEEQSSTTSQKDSEYFAALESGDMETAQRIVNEAAEKAGYSIDSSYQGTSAFNGAAPYGNAYFLTKEERKEAWDNDEFDGDQTLGDYIERGIDAMNLDFIALDPRNYRFADSMRKEAIDNVRNAIQKKSKTITMYRSVPSDIKESSFRNGDWVTPSRAYAVENAKIHGWGDDYRVIEQMVPTDEIWWDGNDIAEWGYGREEDYINDKDFAYKNTSNNKKLLDVITRDDKGNIIPPSKRFDSTKADIRYSIGEKKLSNGSEAKTLVGVHNISETKLLKAIKQGGLANPSIAVIDALRQEHDGYGEISLIMPSNKIAKSTGKNAGTWQGDAYTPTYPHIERQISEKGSEQAFNDISSVPKEMQSRVKNGINRWLDGDDVNSGLAYLFLFEKGKAPEMQPIKSKYSDKVYNDLKFITAGDFKIGGIGKVDTEKVISIYINTIYNGNKTAYDKSVNSWLEKNKGILEQGKKDGFRYTIALKNIESFDKYGFNYNEIQKFVSDVESDQHRTGIDTNAVLKASEEYISNNKLGDDFERWLDKKSKQYEVKEVIFDGFTPSGNRKYVPNTLENVSKLMNKQGRNGTTGLGISFQNFAAKLMASYGTLKDIRSMKGLLTSNHEDVDNFRDKWSNVFYDLGMKCQPDATNTFDDYGLIRLSEAAVTKDPQAFLKKEYNVDFSDEDTKRLKEMVQAIKEEYPAMYFETKFERPVTFDEFSTAVVPISVKNNIKESLKNSGVSIFEYNPDIEGDRKRAFDEAVNSKDDIKFSIGEKRLSNDTEAKQLAFDAAMTMLGNAGIPVEMLSDEAMRQMAEKTSMLNTALPEEGSSFKGTVISSIDGIKILNNLDKAIDRYNENPDNRPSTFLGDLASALGSSDINKSSQYATFETKNGQVVTIRISNHNATVSNFDNSGEDNGISIVISRKPNEGIRNDGNAHIVEFFYSDKALNKSDRKPLVEILKSVKQSLYSGEYKDTTGLAQVQEVNAESMPEFMTWNNSPRAEWLRHYVTAMNLVTGKDKKTILNEFREKLVEAKKEAKELYANVLSGNFNSVTLQQINNYIDNATNGNRFYRPLSQRLPERALAALSEGGRTSAVDALFSRICESTVPANGRTRAEARRAIETRKEELLEGWAKATGNWHESIADFTGNTAPIKSGTDSDVYLSDDGGSVIKASKGKFDNRKFPSDIDQVNLFNAVFPHSAYRILGYGRLNGRFVRFIEQQFVDFSTSQPLTTEERVEYMRRLGFEPRNEEKTVFSNGEIVVSDLQKSNIVKDTEGNIRVIDADVKLHTKDIGGNYTYPPVETDTEVPEFMTVYHGSGAKFDRFDHSHIGEGEGAQAYGWGTYVTEVEGIGRTYATTNSLYKQELESNIARAEERLPYIKDEQLRKQTEEQIAEWKKQLADYGTARNLYTVEIPEDINSHPSVDELCLAIGSLGKSLFSGYGLNEAQINALYNTTLQWYEHNRDATNDFFPAKAAFKTYSIDAEAIDKSIRDEAMERRRENSEEFGNYLSYAENTPFQEVRKIYNALYSALVSDEERGYLDAYSSRSLRKELDSLMDEQIDGKHLYGTISSYLGSDKEASQFLHSLGYVGISYPAEFRTGGRSDGAKNYVIFNENDAKIVDHIEFLKDGDIVYGAAVGGKILLNQEHLNPNTPIHEYTHLWDKACQQKNPELWKRGVELMKQTSLWKEVESDPNYTGMDERTLASEVHARLSGENGAALLEKMSKKVLASNERDIMVKIKKLAVIEELKDWLHDFWSWIKNTMTGWTKEEASKVSLDDFINMPIADLAKGIDLSDVRTKYNEPTLFDIKGIDSTQDDSVRYSIGEDEKTARIEKLRKSEPVKITGEEYKGKYELKRDSAKRWLKDNIRGEYMNDDTGKTITIGRKGINKVTSHSMGNDGHLKSIVAIPEMLKKAVFITKERASKPNAQYPEYEYYVIGMKIGDVDYTAKLTIGIDENGNKFYDHALTKVEKGKLLDQINDQAVNSGFISTAITPSVTENKDIKLLSILQNNSSKVVNENGEFSPANDDIRYSIGEDETAQIIERAKADGTYMKAPNGKSSNLNERQWAQVRTSAFKNWFGDWEKAARIGKLRDSKPASISGKEITVSDDFRQNKKNALEYGKGLQGSYVNKDTGTSIQLRRGRKNGGLHEVLQHNYKDREHIQSIAAIPQIIENSIHIDNEANKDTAKNPSVTEYQHYVCGLNIGGTDYTVLATVAVDKNGGRYYDHNLTRIEKGKLLDQINGQAVNRESFDAMSGTNPTTLSHKDRRLLSILQTDSSKVVDENGEPMVVYHGRSAEFNTFEKKEGIRFVMGLEDKVNAEGFFFSPDEEFAAKYANNAVRHRGGKPNVVSCFLNIRRPMDLTADNFARIYEDVTGWEYNVGMDSQDNMWEIMDEVGMADKLKAKGYDGAIFVEEMDEKYEPTQVSYCALDANQIKSADENNGEFSPANDDIRFSIGDFRNGLSDQDDIYDAFVEVLSSNGDAVELMQSLEEYYNGSVRSASEGAKLAMRDGLLPFPRAKYAGKDFEYHHIMFESNDGETFVEAVPFDSQENVEKLIINRKFNSRLQKQIDGTLRDGYIYELGYPSNTLINTGVPSLPIELSSSHLADKAKQRNHQFDLSDIKDLPNALQNPIAVFAYGNKDKAQNIIVAIERDKKKFVIGLHFNQERRGLIVNDIRGIFNKDNAEWLNWINQGKSLYLNKQEIQALIDKQRTNLAEVEYLDLDSIAKIVKEFENPISSEEVENEESGVRYSVVEDKDTLRRLNLEPKMKVYRAMQLVDGKLYPPMSGKVNGEWRHGLAVEDLGKVWEQADENPELVDDKGYFTLNKGNGKSLKARYNPYIHTSQTPLNDQFSSAQDRPELVTVEVEVPVSELYSKYKAEKAKDRVGALEWKAGVIQAKLSGTRTVILSRWDRPMRIVPNSEVADEIVKMFKGKQITMPSNVVTPDLRAELEKRGVPFVETDNKGREIKNAVKFSIGEDLESVNARFNEELERYQNGELNSNDILHLGNPQGVMRMFLPNLPIIVRQRILTKGSVKKHNVDVGALVDMPKYLSYPIFVFQRNDNRLGVLTEMKDRDNKNVCIAVELNRLIQNGTDVLEVNDIRSIHGRNVADIVYPIIQNGTLSWADKEKGLEYLSSASRYVQQEIDKQDLLSATKVVENFVNPILRPENSVEYSIESLDSREKLLSGELEHEKAFDMLMDIYYAIPEDVRKQIIGKAPNFGYNFADATAGYFARLSMSEEDFNNNEWDAIKAMRDTLKSSLNLEELSLYDSLWAMCQLAYKGKTDVLSSARKALAAHKLGFTPKAIEQTEETKDAVNYSISEDMKSSSAAEMYARATSYLKNRLKETTVDMYESINDLVSAIEIATGEKAETFEDIRLALNQQSSKGLAEMEKYTRDYLQPLFDTLKQITNKTGLSYDDVSRYVILKHAIERNEVFAKRDARAYYRSIMDSTIITLQKENAELNRKRKLLITDGELDAASAIEKKLEDNRILIAKAKADYEYAIKRVESEDDEKYKEYREQDYGGLTSMFSEYPGLQARSAYKSDEAYNQAARKVRKPLYDNVADMEKAALKEVEDFEKKLTNPMVDLLWSRINAATKATLDSQYQANMLSREQYAAVKDQFKYYVPLRGFKDVAAEDIWSYYNSSRSDSFAPPLISAKGRTTEAENPFNWIGTMASSAIAAGVKNQTKLALYYFIVNRPNQDLVSLGEIWYRYDAQATSEYRSAHPESEKRIFSAVYPPIAEGLSTEEAKEAYYKWEQDLKEAKERGEAYQKKDRLNVSDDVVFVSAKQEPEHIIRCRVLGREVDMIINSNPRAAQAVNGLLNLETDKDYQKVFGKILRYLSAINTSLNPEFWISNMQRDLLFGVMSTFINGQSVKSFGKNLLSPKRIMKLMKDYREGTLGNGRLEDYYREFAENGAITGYTVINNNEYWEKQIQSTINPNIIDKAKASKFLAAWQNLGEATEQMTRFAAYITARENGQDVASAVSAAKEITVNFNRKGSGKAISKQELKQLLKKNGEHLSDLEVELWHLISFIPAYGRRAIMFFNAGVQALNAMYKLQKKDSTIFSACMLGYFLLGVSVALLQGMLGGDDDDNDYLDMSDYVRRNNLLIGTNGIYLKWALPQEARIFYGFGDMLVGHLMGREPHKNIITEVATSVNEMLPLPLIPIGVELRDYVPSSIQPLVDVWTNKDFTGSRVYNDLKYLSDEERKRTPRYQYALSGTGAGFVEASKLLNILSGGNEYDAGWANVPPEVMQHIVEQLGGGLLTTVNKGARTLTGAVDAISGKDIFGQDLSVRNTPFLNRVVVVNDDRTRNAYVTELFNYYKAEAMHAKTTANKIGKKDGLIAKRQYMNSPEYEIYKVYDKYRPELKRYDEQIKAETDRHERKQLMREQDEVRRKMIKEFSYSRQ